MPPSSDWFEDIKEVPLDTPQLNNALIVEKVALRSPGKNIGLKAGDYLMSVNGKSAHSVNLDEALIHEKSVKYVFYRAEKNTENRVKPYQKLHDKGTYLSYFLGITTQLDKNELTIRYKQQDRLIDQNYAFAFPADPNIKNEIDVTLNILAD